MLNVFLIVHDFSGAKTYADELSGYLVRKKDVFVFQIYLHYANSTEFSIQEKNQVTSVYIPEKINKKYDKKYYKRAAQLVFFHFNHLANVIVHANMPDQLYMAEETVKLFNCPLVYTLHFMENYYSYFDQITGYNKDIDITGDVLMKAMLAKADHVICVTSFSHRTIVEQYKIEPSKVSVIYNGLEVIDEFSNDPQILKIQYGFLPEDRILLYAGKLETRKGIDKLIKAFLLLKDRLPTTKLVIAGSGEYNSYLPLAQKCIGRISFTGNLPKTTLIDFYRFSEIGIIPSQYEQCSYVAIEMMQHGLPLIISDVPGLNELVIHKETGLICRTQPHENMLNVLEADDADLALQLEYLLTNKETGLILANAARFQTMERHSVDKMGNSTLKIYNHLIKKVQRTE